MAKPKDRYERLRTIHEQLNRFDGGRVSMKTLVKVCEVSERTMFSDLKALVEDFGAPISNDKSQGGLGYYYTKPYELPAIENLPLQERDLQQLTMVGEILNQFEGLTLFQEFRGVIQKISNAIKYKIFKNQTKYSNQTTAPSEPIIHFESVPYSKGSEFIATFYDATEKQHEVTFLYQKFDGAEIKKHTIQPHWLKEHKNRWYVIGINVKYGDFNAFGLDRVQAPPNTGGYFKRSTTTLQELTKHSYGLRIPTKKDRVEKVVLRMTPKRGRYFKAQPLFKYHKTRDVLADNDQEFRVQTQLIINEEFEMELAKLGDSVTVIAPALLRKNVMNYHKAAAENYGLEWCESDKEE